MAFRLSLAQLTAPHYGYRGNTIVVEAKDDVRKRIGTSTDEADAVLQAWHAFPQAVARAHKVDPVSVAEGGWNEGAQNRNPDHYVEDLVDPLENWDVD